MVSASLEDPRLLMTHQNAMRFYDDIAYDHDFPGPGNTDEEGRRLAAELGDKRVLMMCGHGVLTAASSVALAFDMAYYMERCAMFQVHMHLLKYCWWPTSIIFGRVRYKLGIIILN